MGARNYLIDGVSGTGKTSVCHELRRRGYQAFNGDRDLAYRGNPMTGEPVERPVHDSDAEGVAWVHGNQLWDVDKVKSLVADHSMPVSFFCGGFIELFDGVFVLEVDRETLIRRLAGRPEDEFGGRQVDRDLILRLHATKEDIPSGGVVIDTTAPLERVVDDILQRCL